MVIAYLRVSTERQHLENQQGEIERYAKTKGITIDRWVTEIVSGKTDRNNRKLGRIVSQLKKGDMLIVTELSRLSRSLHEIMQIMKLCVDNEVIVYSTKDGYTFDDSINSKVLSFAFGLAAEIEHKLISQRTREAMALRKLEGLHMGRKKGTTVKMQQLRINEKEITKLLLSGENIGKICKRYGVSYNTFYRYKKENTELPSKKLKRH